MSDRIALLFDLDGTLLDTDALHFAAFQALLKDYDRSITLDYYSQHIMGASNGDIMRGLFPDLPERRYPELGERKEALFRAELSSSLTPKGGLLKLLDWVDAHNIPACVVTNAPRKNAELMLQGLGLQARLRELLIGDELLRGKPDPFPYQEGLRRLGAKATQAFAFEDSGPGVMAASRAGIFTFGMAGALSHTALKAAGASAVIEDFSDPLLWDALVGKLNMAESGV